MTIAGDRLKRARTTGFAGVRLAGMPAIPEGIADPITGSSQSVGYNGGSIITCPQIYASFWGELWQKDAAHQARATRLAQFLTDLPHSTFMNVLSQYGVGGGANLAGSFFQSSFYYSRGWYLDRPFPTPPGWTILNDRGIQETVQLLTSTGCCPCRQSTLMRRKKVLR
jgi:hypothetical protein